MFQYSTSTIIDKTATTTWTTEQAVTYWSMSDSLGNRSRVAQVCIDNVLGLKERRYHVMQQVRITDNYGVVVFLGRVMNIEPVFAERKLILICRDYLGELSEKLVTAKLGEGSYTAASRNWLIKELLDNELEDPGAGGDMDKTLVPRLLQDPGNYLERITKTYSQKGAYGSITDGIPGNYQYRGVKTILEAISEIASEDAQQDLMVLSYSNTASLSDITSANHVSAPKIYPSTYWVDYTAGLQDGNEWFPTTRQVSNVSTPNAIGGSAQDILYIGSNSKFDGIEYTFRQTGATIHQSDYLTLAWQYWSGEGWKTFTPDKDLLFKQDSSVTDRVMGSTIWPSLIHDETNTHDDVGQRSYSGSGQGMSDWEKRDLSENHDMPHFNDWNDNDSSGWQSWRTPWHKSPHFNNFRIANGTNHLYLYKDSFTPDTDLKTNAYAYLTSSPAEHTLRDGDQVTISGLDPDTSGINAFNGTWYVRYTNSSTTLGDEHTRFELYTAYAGNNALYGTEWSNGNKKTNSIGSDITQASVLASAASEARVTVASSTRQVDMKSDAIAAVNIGGLTHTNRYWVRVWVKTASTSPATGANIATMELRTKANVFRDFRAEDPKFFDEIWEYESQGDMGANQYAHYSGGTWTSKNTTAGNSGTGEPLLWDIGTHETTFLDSNRKAWFFGADEPFNGIELHAVQGVSRGIRNIAATNPAQITLAADPSSSGFELDTGDYVLITGSNSGVSIDGYHQVTRIPQSQLAEQVHISETEIDVDPSHGFTPLDVILVEDEYMGVISVSGNTLTVERGLHDSIPVTHADNTAIKNTAKYTVPVDNSSGAVGNNGILRTGVPNYSNRDMYVDILDLYSKTQTGNLPNIYSAWRTLTYDDIDQSWSTRSSPGSTADHGPLAPLGPARWRLDAGRSKTEANHWYTEIRFNTSLPRDSIAQADLAPSTDILYTPWSTKRHIAQTEFDAVYPMSDSPVWNDRQSLLGPNSFQSYGAWDFEIDSIDYNLDTTGSYAKSGGTFSTGQLDDSSQNSMFTASGEDRLLVVGITTQDSSGAVAPTAVNYGDGAAVSATVGSPLTLAGSQSVGNVNVTVWYLLSPVREATAPGASALGSASDHSRFHITVPSEVDHLDVHVQTLFGVDAVHPVGTAATATATSNAPSVTATTKANQIVFDCVAINSNTSAAEGADQTEIGTAGGITGNSSHRSVSSYERASGASTAMTWALGASQPWAAVALPINTSKPLVRINIGRYSSGPSSYLNEIGETIAFLLTPGSANAGGWDGSYKITDAYIRGSQDTFDFDMRAFGVDFTGAVDAPADGPRVTIQIAATPPNVKSLHWARIRMSGVPANPAELRSVRTSNVARFKYFDRGKEPWVTSKTERIGGSSALQDLDAVYHYDKGRLAGMVAGPTGDTSDGFLSSSNHRYEAIAIDSLNGYARIQTKQELGGSSSSTARPHYLQEGDWVEILNVAAHPNMNGIWKVSYVFDASRFVIDFPYSGNLAFANNNSNAPYIYPTNFIDYTAEARSPSSKRELSIIDIAVGASDCEITTTPSHGLSPGDAVLIGETVSTNSNPTIGTTSSSPGGTEWIVRAVTAHDKFVIEYMNGTARSISTAGDQGSITTAKGISSISAASPAVVTTRNAHGYSAGQRIYFGRITGGTPALGSVNPTDRYIVAKVLTPTTFTVSVNTSGAATANTGYIMADSAMLLQSRNAANSPNGIPNLIEAYDAVYFGSKRPFTQLRFALEERLSGFGIRNGYISSRAWQYFRSDLYGRSDGWSQGGFFDPSLGFVGRGSFANGETTLDTPGLGAWKTTNPGVIGSGQSPNLYLSPASPQTIALDHRIGKHLYYQRMQISTLVSPNGGAVPTNVRAAASQVWSGPDLWDRDREVGTLPGVASERHATELATYGLSFNDRLKTINEGNTVQVMEYSLKDKALDFINRVTVRGRAGAYATIDDRDSIDFYQMIKEKVVEDSSLITDTQCFQRATALLEQLKPRRPMSILTIDAANPTKITVGGDTKYRLWSSATGATGTFRVFEREGLKIVANSRGVSESAADGTGTPSTSTSGVSSGNNWTYVTTAEDHGLTTGDAVLFSNIQNAATLGVAQAQRWLEGGLAGVSSTDVQGVATIYVVSPRQFKWTAQNTGASGTPNDGVGGLVHKPAKTKLRIGDEVRITSHGANFNGLRTVTSSADDGATLQTTYTSSGNGYGTLAGYLTTAQPHNLTSGDKVLLRNTSSVPSIDGYRAITRLNDTQFTVNVDTSSGQDGVSGAIRPTSIREATLTIRGWPVYTVRGQPRALRAGDMVEVTLENAGIYGENWLCYAINKDGAAGHTTVTLFRDLNAVSESGDQERKLLRDLGSRVRETANAVFQPIDKTVESGLDFLPEGPGRASARLEYGATGSASNIDIPDPAVAGDYVQAFPDDFRLSLKLYENFGTREKLGTDLMRIDGQGIRADGAGDAKGGAGLTLIARSKTGETGATEDFHPGPNEATLYLRQGRTLDIASISAANTAVVTTAEPHGMKSYANSGWTGNQEYVVIAGTNAGADSTYDGRMNGTWKVYSVTNTTQFRITNTGNNATNGSAITNAGTVKILGEGNGLYLANRGIWNDSKVYDEWGHDTLNMQHELLTGFTGFITPASDGKAKIILPSLDSIPYISLNVCAAHSDASDQYIANITGWDVSDMGNTYFTGNGVDNMVLNSTTFDSLIVPSKEYRVQITSTGSPNQFRWSDNRASAATRDVWNATGVNVTTSGVALSDGVNVKWGSTTGHWLNDYWDFTASNDARQKYVAAEMTVFNDAGAAVDCGTDDVHVMYMVVFNSSRAHADGQSTFGERDSAKVKGFTIHHGGGSGTTGH